MVTTKIKADDLTHLDLVKEAVEMVEYGWHKEVWYNKETDEITFSGWMSTNSWNETESEDDVCLGTIDSLDITQLEGYYNIDDEFVEIDDSNNETDPGFKDKEKDYERHYDNSSIVPMDDALGYIADMAELEDGWYEDIFSELEKIKNDETNTN